MSGRLERLRERTNGYTLTPEQYLRVAWVALVALTLIVLTGAAVRLTGSGLGCPTWPKCYGNVYPPLRTHALIEFSNRMITVPVSIAAGLAWLGALRRRPYRRDLMWLGALLPLGVVAQAVLGGFTVRGQLDYGWVMGHFALSMLILVAAVVLVWRAGRPQIGHEPGYEVGQDEPGEQLIHSGTPASASYDPRQGGAETVAPAASAATGLLDRRLVLAARTLVGLASLTIVAGTAATAAGPHAGGSPGQKINRMDFDGRGTMDFVIHRHAEIAFVFSLAAVAVWFFARRLAAPQRIRRPLTVLCVLLALQGVVGLDQYETHLPTELVWIHVALASLTWLTVLWAGCAAGRLAPRAEPATEHRVAPPARASA
jgi:heme a synthase